MKLIIAAVLAASGCAEIADSTMSVELTESAFGYSGRLVVADDGYVTLDENLDFGNHSYWAILSPESRDELHDRLALAELESPADPRDAPRCDEPDYCAGFRFAYDLGASTRELHWSAPQLVDGVLPFALARAASYLQAIRDEIPR